MNNVEIMRQLNQVPIPLRYEIRSQIGRLAFYEGLKSVLKRDPENETKDIQALKEFGDYLKWTITHLIERVHKLALLNDDLNLSALIKETVDLPISRLVEQKEKPWLADKLTVGIIGHFSVGKTTVLNSIFNEQFPTDDAENTAIPTYLSYGYDVEKMRLVDQTGKVVQIARNEASLFDLNFNNKDTDIEGVSHFDEQFPFARIFNYMQKDNTNELLKKLTFIDMPGYFSKTVDNSGIVNSMIANCDVILWLIDIRESETKPEIDYIVPQLKDKPVVLVLTYTDDIDIKRRIRREGETALTESISIVVDAAKAAGANIKGVMTYGKSDSIVANFKNQITLTLKEFTEEYEPYNPVAQIYSVLKGFHGILEGCRKRIADSLSEANTAKKTALNEYTNATQAFVTANKSLCNRLNTLVDTFNRRCSDAWGCGGAKDAMRADIRSVISALDSLQDAYNDIPESKLVAYGTICAYESTREEKLKEIVELIAEFQELIDKFE